MIRLDRVDIEQSLAQLITEQRRLNYRDQGTRGWQSKTYTSQPFSWFNTTYQQVETLLGPIDSFWFNVNTQGEGTGWHSHSRYQTVAVLYVTVPSGNIEFKQGEAYWQETPKSGDLLVFPGSLEHRVLSNNSSDYRISVAFNVLPVRVV